MSDIVDYLCQLGYSGDHGRDTVKVLYESKCIETTVPGLLWAQAESRLRATPLGRYHVTALCNTFAYVDAVVIDTPILDPSARRKVTDVWAIEERLERALEFTRYLDSCSSNLSDASALELWHTTYAAVHSDILQIQQRLSE